MAVRLLLALALAVSIWPFVGTGNAHACPGPRYISQEKRIDWSQLSDHIFVGTVITAVDPDRDQRVRSFAVERYLKGDGARQFTFVGRPPICGSSVIEMEVGNRYLVVWAGGEGGWPNTDLHWFSSAEAEDLIAEMEATLLAEYGTLGSFTDEPLPPWATAASFGAAVLLSVGLLIGVRRLASR